MTASRPAAPDGRLYVSDLDGTLLRDDGTLSRYARRELRRIIRSGLRFTVASARHTFSIRQALGGLLLDLPAICANGALVSDLRTGRHRMVAGLEAELARELLLLFRGRGTLPFVASTDGRRDHLRYETLRNEGMDWYRRDRRHFRDRRLRRAAALEEALEEQVVAYILIDRPEPLVELAAELGQRFAGRLGLNPFTNHYSPGWNWLMIQDSRATKDQALRVLLEELDMQPEQLTVFGDNLNDEGMFRLAGRAVAVANAQPELKRLASEVIGTNEEESVVGYLVREASGGPPPAP